jgi:hypothetical protein
MSGEPDQQRATLLVTFGDAPREGVISPLCQTLLDVCLPVLGDHDAALRLRLAAQELLENIAKYSLRAECEFRFELRREEAGYFASVRTRNRPRPENRADAERRLSALNAAADPVEHYDAMIAASAATQAGSGLGLARIHAETEYRLSHRFDGDELLVIASGYVSLGRPTKPASR